MNASYVVKAMFFRFVLPVGAGILFLLLSILFWAFLEKIGVEL